MTIVDAGAKKAFDLRVEVPVEDMARLGEALEPSAAEIPEDRPASRDAARSGPRSTRGSSSSSARTAPRSSS